MPTKRFAKPNDASHGHLVHHRPLKPVPGVPARRPKNPATQGRLPFFNPGIRRRNQNLRRQSYSALQLNPDHLKRLVVQIFRQTQDRTLALSGSGGFHVCYHADVQRAEALWLKIIGVLLILLGLVLFASPRIMYSTREKVIDTESIHITAKREKSMFIPRAVALLTIAAGVGALILASRNRQ
jgi:hypothetical protein